jgi:hypothetical protein
LALAFDVLDNGALIGLAGYDAGTGFETAPPEGRDGGCVEAAGVFFRRMAEFAIFVEYRLDLGGVAYLGTRDAGEKEDECANDQRGGGA